MSKQSGYRISIVKLSPSEERYPNEEKLYEQIVSSIDIAGICGLVNKIEVEGAVLLQKMFQSKEKE